MQQSGTVNAIAIEGYFAVPIVAEAPSSMAIDAEEQEGKPILAEQKQEEIVSDNFNGLAINEGDDGDASAYSWGETIASGTKGEPTVSSQSVSSRGSLRNGALRNAGSSRHSTRDKRASSLKKSTVDFTVNKLQFKRLGRLYGRDKECEQLHDAWDAVRRARKSATTVAANGRKEGAKQTGARRLVTIAGASGTGKSTLADTLRLSVLREGGFYVIGKFPQQRRLSRESSEPYAAFALACSDLCELVVSQFSPGAEAVDNNLDANSFHGGCESIASSRTYYKFTLSEFRDRLDKELGDDATVLTRVIPGLRPILKAGSLSESIGYREAHHQFKFAFRRFIRTVTSFGPMVLVLDDMQWGDAASMELLEALISDRESDSLLVIVCYRDDDVFLNMPHINTVDKLRDLAKHDARLHVDSLLIGNLDVNQIQKLLVDLMSLSEVDALGLAGCVYRKTMGNIFFVIQFVSLLADSDLLTFNLGTLKWSFDLEAIQLLTAATENVVSLVKARMTSLPPTIVKVLPMMGCLGSTFNGHLFEMVVNHCASSWDFEPEDSVNEENQADPEQNRPTSVNRRAAKCLSRCEEEGLIEAANLEGEESYFWAHDKIQEASFALVSDEELQNLKLQLGKILYEQLTPSALDNHIFLVANLLNTESTNPNCYPRQRPLEIATLYLRAGVKAIENSAFEQATGYLCVGIELLPKNHWQTNYQLSLELFSTAAEAEFCTGKFDRMQNYCGTVLEQDSPLLDKRRVYNVLLDYTAAEKEMGEAFALCQSILVRLNCKFAKRALTLHVVGGLLRLKVTLKQLDIAETLSSLPALSDEGKQWMMSLLDKFTTYAYLAKPELLPLVVFKGFRTTLKDGFTEYSSPALAFLGLLLAAFVHDYKGGLAMANQAIELLKKAPNARKVESRVMHITHAFVLHWLRPLSTCIKPLLKGYEIGMAMGDTGSAAWCIFFYIEHSLRTGVPLEVVIADCEFYCDRLREVQQSQVVHLLSNIREFLMHLTGAIDFSRARTGSMVSHEKGLGEASQEFYDYNPDAHYRMHMYVAFVLGNHDLVYEAIRITNMDKGHYEQVFPGIAGIYYLYAYNGLSMISLYRSTKKKQFLKMAKRFAIKIKGWVTAGVSDWRVPFCI